MDNLITNDANKKENANNANRFNALKQRRNLYIYSRVWRGGITGGINLYCIYNASEVYSGVTARTYLERMSQVGRVQPLLADQIAHVTANKDGHYAIANNAGEVFFIGNNGITGVQRDLKRLRPSSVLVNGADYEAYRVANSAVVYFIYIRRTSDRRTYFVALQKTREGVDQGVKTFVGTRDAVQKDVQAFLSRVKDKYYVHYVNEAYRLPGVQERQLLREFDYDGGPIREALRAAVADWKRKEVSAA